MIPKEEIIKYKKYIESQNERKKKKTVEYNKIFHSVKEVFDCASDVAKFYVDIAASSDNEKDFINKVLIEDQNKESNMYARAGSPYAELERIYSFVRSRL